MAQCAHCGEIEEEFGEPLYELKIDVTGEYWMMCEPCLDEFTDWL